MPAQKISEKRVAIAKDVLKRIRGNKLKIRAGAYLSGSNKTGVEKGSAQEHIKSLEENCEVCALGASFLSYIRLYNKVDLADIFKNSFLSVITTSHVITTHHIDTSGTFIAEKLGKVFSLETLELVEAAFERGGPFFPVNSCRYHSSDQKIEKATKFGKKYSNNRSRLQAIMANIIKNNGKFVVN